MKREKKYGKSRVRVSDFIEWNFDGEKKNPLDDTERKKDGKKNYIYD